MNPETTYQAVLGRLIVIKRQEREMDQGEMARYVGVSRSTWSRIEAGLSALNIDQLAKAASKLGVSVSELTTETDQIVQDLRREDVEVHSSRDEADSITTGAAASKEAAGPMGVFLKGDVLTAIGAAMVRRQRKGPIRMAYKYRPDEGLGFLRTIQSEDLDPLVEFLIEIKNQELTKTEGYQLHHPDHRKYWKEIATEIQTFGGDTFSNVVRDKGTPYREILHDVCDRLKVNYEKGASIELIEANLLEKTLGDAITRLDADEKAMVFEALGADDLIDAPEVTARTLLRASSAAAYRWALIVANGLAKPVSGRTRSFAVKAVLTRGMQVVMGPVGLALGTAWTALDLAGPAYRVTIPAVIYVAALRLKKGQDEQSEHSE